MVAAALAETLASLPPPLVVFLLAAVPVVELRGAIPLALLVYRMPLHEAVLLSIAGNLFPVFFLLGLLGPVEQFLRRWEIFDRMFTKLFDRTVRKLDEGVKRWEAGALAIFVAIPLPVTGAWTGCAAAHAFSLGYWRSLAAIALGVLGAAAIVTFVTLTGEALWLLA